MGACGSGYDRDIYRVRYTGLGFAGIRDLGPHSQKGRAHVRLCPAGASAYFHALNKGKGITRGQFLGALCLAFLYAITDEFHQRFTPGRTPSIYDVLIDTLGAVFGLGIWVWIRKVVVSSQHRLRRSRIE